VQGRQGRVIEDDGPGFPPDIGSRVFERFVKDSHSRGHGLGLTFVDVVAQAHRGSTSVSDRIGGRCRHNFVTAHCRTPIGISHLDCKNSFARAHRIAPAVWILFFLCIKNASSINSDNRTFPPKSDAGPPSAVLRPKMVARTERTRFYPSMDGYNVQSEAK
jgi:hypothetical protein